MTRVIDTYELSPMQAGMLFPAVSGVDRGIDLEQVVATLREPLEEALCSRVAASRDYMVPGDFVTLERLLLTPNGKWTEEPCRHRTARW